MRSLETYGRWQGWGRLETRRPLCLGGGRNETPGAGPGHKSLSSSAFSQIILEAGQRVPWGPFPVYKQGLYGAAPHPTDPPLVSMLAEPDSLGWEGAWEPQ